MQPSEHPFFAAARKDRPEIIAHRGGAGEFPGETIYAFEEAIKLGVDVLEMDVRRTKDGHIILMHDPKVDKTTNGHGRVRKLTMDYLGGLNAAARWATNPAMPHVPIPELSDVFKLMEKFPALRVNIEIKRLDWRLANEVGRLIFENGLADRVLLASGWRSVLQVVREKWPSIATSASVLEILVFQFFDNFLRLKTPLKHIDAIQWHSRFWKCEIITRRFVERAKARGWKVHAWTVNEPEEMARMIEIGVDGIITDYPTTLLKLFP